MSWDREKERKAARGYNIGMGIFALAFSIIWCCMAVASGAWFMLIFGLPFTGFMAYRLAFIIRKSKSEKPKEPWEQPDRPQTVYDAESTPRRDGYCPYCGRTLEEDFSFCPGCGRRL